MKFQNIAIDDQLVKRMHSRLHAIEPAVSVPRTKNMTVGECYQNVRETVAKFEGEVQLGYAICLWPGKYIEALHHAVWRNPQGRLEDVTGPSYFGMEVGEIAFIPDNSISLDPLFDPFIPSEFLLLTISPKVKRYTDQLRERVQLKGALTERGKLKGTAVTVNGRTGFQFAQTDTVVQRIQGSLASLEEKIELFQKGHS